MKRLVESTLNKIINNKKIVPKMIFGYILLVVFPLILFGSINYFQMYDNVVDNHANSKQKLVRQAANSLQVSMAQVNSIYSLFQYNPTVIEYLSGSYQTEGNQVYTYLKDIRPMISYAYLGNQSIQSIQLYKTNLDILPVTSEVEDITELENRALLMEIFNDLEADQGVWLPQADDDLTKLPALSYYQRIYNNQYTKHLATLQVTFDEDFLEDFIRTVTANEEVDSLIVQDDQVIYMDKNSSINDGQLTVLQHTANSEQSEYWVEDQYLFNHLYMENLNLHFYFVRSIEQIYKNVYQQSLFYSLILIGLLLFLSTIYYFTASLLTKRVVNLAKHMRGADENKLSLYNGDKGSDEISYLTQSYNSLIQRIDELMNKVHRAELRKKEADYLALQAQVNPHFLYNTLESIRMLAEMNDDSEVVEATYTLSKLLRYSLSSEGNTSTLEKEIDNIEDYLSIHKIRMMDRLQYEINVNADIKDFRCPRFILQPLVENCIKHGISKVRKKGLISIAINQDNEYLKIDITDNGPGITEERLEKIRGVLNNQLDRSVLGQKNSSLGLYNVSERIKSYFGTESNLEVKSEEGIGTSYILMIKR